MELTDEQFDVLCTTRIPNDGTMGPFYRTAGELNDLRWYLDPEGMFYLFTSLFTSH